MANLKVPSPFLILLISSLMSRNHSAMKPCQMFMVQPTNAQLIRRLFCRRQSPHLEGEWIFTFDRITLTTATSSVQSVMTSTFKHYLVTVRSSSLPPMPPCLHLQCRIKTQSESVSLIRTDLMRTISICKFVADSQLLQTALASMLDS